MKNVIFLALMASLVPGLCSATPITLSVNTITELRTAVSRANLDGANSYTITIAPGTYVDPNLHVSRSMTLDAVTDGTVTLLGSSSLPNRKVLILADGIGTNLTVDGIRFQGAHISNLDGGNGAGDDAAGCRRLGDPRSRAQVQRWQGRGRLRVLRRGTRAQPARGRPSSRPPG